MGPSSMGANASGGAHMPNRWYRHEEGNGEIGIGEDGGAVMCVWPAATSKRSDRRKTRLRTSSFSDTRAGHGSQ